MCGFTSSPVFVSSKLQIQQIKISSLFRRKSQVSACFAKSVLLKYASSACLTDPKASKPKTKSMPGSRTFDELAEHVLLDLRRRNPRRTLTNYSLTLKHLTSTRASESLINSWFLRKFDFRGSLRKTSIVLIDKFKANNV